MDTNANLANADDLAALGLGDLGVPAPVVSAAIEATSTDVVDTDDKQEQAEDGTEAGASETVTVTKTVREQVKIGAVEIEEDIALAPLTRVTGGSKYKFNDLRAPVRKEDNSYSYASMLVTPAEGEDEAKLRRSVQSATTQENKKHKGGKAGFEGCDVYFITRSVADKGQFVGMRVFRVDGTVAKEG